MAKRRTGHVERKSTMTLFQAWILHPDTEEVTEADLSNIICDVLIVLEVCTLDVCTRWKDAGVRLLWPR